MSKWAPSGPANRQSPAVISSTNSCITWRCRPKRCGPRTVRGYFALPVSYQRDRSRTGRAAMTATPWCSVLLRRKTRRLLPTASVVRVCGRLRQISAGSSGDIHSHTRAAALRGSACCPLARPQGSEAHLLPGAHDPHPDSSAPVVGQVKRQITPERA